VSLGLVLVLSLLPLLGVLVILVAALVLLVGTLRETFGGEW
jgi:hypothetical protein